MERKLIGKVTIEEKEQIYEIYLRRSGLTDLVKILSVDQEDLYEKVIKDLGETNARFQYWWDTMAEKYKWVSVENSRWKIDFNTCEIFLITQSS